MLFTYMREILFHDYRLNSTAVNITTVF